MMRRGGNGEMQHKKNQGNDEKRWEWGNGTQEK